MTDKVEDKDIVILSNSEIIVKIHTKDQILNPEELKLLSDITVKEVENMDSNQMYSDVLIGKIFKRLNGCIDKDRLMTFLMAGMIRDMMKGRTNPLKDLLGL